MQQVSFQLSLFAAALWIIGARPARAEVRVLPPVASAALGQTRRVVIYLPPGYHEAKNRARRYPVLYLQDGQNCFDAATAFIGKEWRLDETADALIGRDELSPLIMVGVYNEPTRIEDYRPGLRARRYLRFLTDELKPRIDRAYRPLTDPRYTAIMGSSMGGLFSTFAPLARPDVFGQAASLSAVFHFQGGALPRMVSRSAKQPVRLYFDIGSEETPTDGARWVR